jgi:hypothetical protein
LHSWCIRLRENSGIIRISANSAAPRRRGKPTSYRLFKPKGRQHALAFVEIAGRRYYLGEHGTRMTQPGSWKNYGKLIRDLWFGPLEPHDPAAKVKVDDLTFLDLLAAYIPIAAKKYHKHGKATGTLANIKLSRIVGGSSRRPLRA